MNTVKLFSRKFKKTLKDAKYRSTKKDIAFDLTFQDLRDLFYNQKCKCFYTGKDFNLYSKTDNPSLDRIDSSKGYVKGNVVWCRSRINFMKYNDDYEDFLLECRSILEHRPNWNKVSCRT
jgi:hypothetical protein